MQVALAAGGEGIVTARSKDVEVAVTSPWRRHEASPAGNVGGNINHGLILRIKLTMHQRPFTATGVAL
jgi:hypothetical protein